MILKMVTGIITIIVLVCLVQTTIPAQQSTLERRISVFFNDESLLRIIKNIDGKLNSVFSYKEDIIPTNIRRTLNENNKTVKEILDKVLSGTGIGYKEYNGKIILNREPGIKKVTVSGTVTDASTGESLIGANIIIQGTNIGTSSNQYGFYSITLDEGRYTLICSYIGYQTKIINDLELNNSLKIGIELEPISVSVGEVVVEDTEYEQNINSSNMGVNILNPKNVEMVPVLFGEQDIIKTMQLMPGISTVGEGSSGFIVRGGSIDQNQILLDEAVVYNASHLLGFFSVFNSDAIKNVKVIKGNFPAEYGGRLSSVMDIKMKEGNNKNYAFSGGLGLIASRLTVEGPIEKDKSSFIVTGRRTYLDLFLPLAGSDYEGSKLYFYDLNAKANYILGEHDRIYLSGYFGRDVISVEDLFGLDWGNATTTFRWNHIFGDKLFMNLTGIYSEYDYDIELNDREETARIASGIRDIVGKIDFNYYINERNTFNWGTQITKQNISPGEISPGPGSNFNPKKIEETKAYEASAYISHELKLGKFNFNYGLRFSNYLLVGPGNVYSFDEEGNMINIERFESGEIIKSYNGLEPRISAVYFLNNSNSIKAAYSRNRQYLHLLSSSNAGTPVDIWQASTKNVKPGIADQYSIGYFQNFDDNNYEFSIEAYYKNLKNQIEFKSGTDIVLNEFVEGDLEFGRGWSYGIELMLKKNIGNLSGWVGYTLSKTERQFPGIDDGRVFPASQDRTHDISLVGMYKLDENWSFSFNWIYQTGNATTFPNGKYIFEGMTVNYVTERNGYRMPAYHRMDFGATYNFSPASSLNISIYNVYGRKNAYSIIFRENENDPIQTEAVRYALFSIVPSITYNFRF